MSMMLMVMVWAPLVPPWSISLPVDAAPLIGPANPRPGPVRRNGLPNGGSRTSEKHRKYKFGSLRLP